jgi:hypothetical protein
VKSACIRTESGAPALVCRANAVGDDGCCSTGGGNAADPVAAIVGLAVWFRRRHRRFSRGKR